MALRSVLLPDAEPWRKISFPWIQIKIYSISSTILDYFSLLWKWYCIIFLHIYYTTLLGYFGWVHPIYCWFLTLFQTLGWLQQRFWRAVWGILARLGEYPPLDSSAALWIENWGFRVEWKDVPDCLWELPGAQWPQLLQADCKWLNLYIFYLFQRQHISKTI